MAVAFAVSVALFVGICLGFFIAVMCIRDVTVPGDMLEMFNVDPDHGFDSLNPASKLPPVDCPLLIETSPGILERAYRPAFVESRNNSLVYRTDDGQILEGKFRWTYP